MKKEKLNIVWFKRDLRLHDHEPLWLACNASELAREKAQNVDKTLGNAENTEGVATVLLYCFEPSVMQHYDADVRHFRFVYQSLMDIKKQLKGAMDLLICHNEADKVFNTLMEKFDIQTVFSHEEIGNNLTYDRDKRLKKTFKNNHIIWNETPCGGIQRGLKNRQNWKENWDAIMQKPLINPHFTQLTSPKTCPLEFLTVILRGAPLPSGITKNNPNFQPGGETAAWRYLRSFFEERGKAYMKNISKPESARRHCGRISPYLAWGCLSTRQVLQFSAANAAKIGRRGYIFPLIYTPSVFCDI